MEPLDRYMGVVIEEYRTLRDESKQATINMWTAMQWTSVIFAALFGVGLNQWSADGPTAILVFGLLVPCFSFITMVFWLGEAVRLKRLGDYVYLLEHKIYLLLDEEGGIPVSMIEAWPPLQRAAEYRLRMTSELGDTEIVSLAAPLAWETWLRERRIRGGIHAHQGILFAFRLGFFLMISVGSLVLAAIWWEKRGATLEPLLHNLVLFMGPIVLIVTLLTAYISGSALNARLRV